MAYTALGKLYLKELPLYSPRRLTRDDRMEFAPAFSPDGEWIVYATWTDAAKGRIRMIRAEASGARDLVTTPGHYSAPSFSPDGEWVTYQSGVGDAVRGPTHG